MSIDIRLDLVMVKSRIRLNDLASRVGITEANLSILKNNKAKAIRLSTLNALCRELDCQPGDLIQYIPDERD
ncbi:helix-turn-helix transcriptional regulator [bacterium]|nr:helix-turn-helix transcriptional regulator [bacterium]